jgi:peroxiredoxin
MELDKKIDAPEFTLPDLKGRKRSLSDFQGRFIMLNFWATW